MVNRIDEYNNRIKNNTNLLNLNKKKLQYLPFLRITTFLLCIFFIFDYINNNQAFYLIFGIISLIAFLLFGLIDNRLKTKSTQYKNLIQINKSELKAFDGDYSGFDNGIEFTDIDHYYSHDLDIFGNGSLFQVLSRSATIFGKLKLADLLQNAVKYKDEILKRQLSVKELASSIEFRQKMQLIFFEQSTSIENKSDLIDWLQTCNTFRKFKLVQFIAYLLPCITCFTLILSFFGIIPFPAILIIIQLIIVASFGKRLLKTNAVVTSKYKIIHKYAEVLDLIETTSFESEFLLSLKKDLIYDKIETPGKIIKRLAGILNYMDANLNILASLVLNGLFMFNLHLLLSVEKWKTKYKNLVPRWFEVIAEFDSISGLANFSYNNPEYCFPGPVFDNFEIKARDIGHPMIPKDKRISNSFEIKGWRQFYIVTGANMSGKSTFLRTIGTNYILAMIGAPVAASSFSFFPIQLHSSIRTNDSLTKNESYFYAELKRLKQIIDELEKGNNKLILLDEILKGTNSKDKQAGSIAFIKQLLKYNSVGLFATHDLLLGELEDHFPEHVKNLCFEIEIKGDQMIIDYKLHPGVCKNLNATFLMKNMGILLDN